MPTEEDLIEIKRLLDSAENQIRKAKGMIFEKEISEKAKEVAEDSIADNVFEGIFDGENFITSAGKKYQVPANYASKSKLVTGDHLKLTILNNGSFVFKQINPVARRNVVGVLEQSTDGSFHIDVDGSLFNVLTASVTYFKAQAGDKLVCLIPEDGKGDWAAIENLYVE